MLPVETVHKIGDKTFFSFDEEQFRIILKIYATYDVLSKINLKLLAEIENADQQRNIAVVTMYKCVETLEAVNNDRVMIHKIRNSERAALSIKDRKTKIKNALIISGTGVAGVGIGILIGIFAVRR